jgi:hypothetical protein
MMVSTQVINAAEDCIHRSASKQLVPLELHQVNFPQICCVMKPLHTMCHPTPAKLPVPRSAGAGNMHWTAGW